MLGLVSAMVVSMGVTLAADTPETEHGFIHPVGFWVGAWDVYNREGQLVGWNELTFEAGGAVVHEAWTSAKWGSGVSMNYMDAVDDTLVQVWVSQGGDRLVMSAPLESVTKGRVRMEGEYHLANGGTRDHVTELTALEGGFVRQFITETRGGRDEQGRESPEGGEWVTVFDALYVPRGEKLPAWWPEQIPGEAE